MTVATAVLPLHLSQALERELNEGEKVMWLGQPRPTRFALPGLAACGFGIPWTAFAVFWMVGAWRQSKDLPFTLFGVPFVLIGIGMLSAPLWLMRKARRTVYAVTDRRVLILTVGLATDVETIAPNALGQLKRREKADGSGDILFGQDMCGAPNAASKQAEKGFFGIPDVRHVEQLLLALVAHAKQAAGTSSRSE